MSGDNPVETAPVIEDLEWEINSDTRGIVEKVICRNKFFHASEIGNNQGQGNCDECTFDPEGNPYCAGYKGIRIFSYYVHEETPDVERN